MTLQCNKEKCTLYVVSRSFLFRVGEDMDEARLYEYTDVRN